MKAWTRFTKGDIAIRYYGKVGGLKAGVPPHDRTIMPTLLEWLLAQQAPWLFWSTVTGLATLAFVLLRWLKFDV